MSNKLEITLTRSVIGKTERQRKIIQTLGLNKINDSVVRDDTPTIRGMINKVSHIVMVKEV